MDQNNERILYLLYYGGSIYIQLAHRESIAEFVGNKAAAVSQRGTRFEHARNDGLGIVECDEVINMLGALHTRHAQGIGPSSGCDQQRIIGKFGSIFGGYNSLFGVDVCHHGFGDQLNVTLLMPGKVAYHDLLLYDHALQKAWERNAIIKRVGFIGEELNAAIRVIFA